jgi:broad specificity phosphatase PhoE
MDAGSWTGRTLRSLQRTKLWNTVQRNPSRFQFPAGESFVDAEARVLDEIERIVSRHPRGRVLIGTHGDLVRILVSHYAGAHLDEFQRVLADPASVSVVHLGDGVPRILLVNDTGSLRRFAPESRRGGASARATGSRSNRNARDVSKRKLRG